MGTPDVKKTTVSVLLRRGEGPNGEISARSLEKAFGNSYIPQRLRDGEVGSSTIYVAGTADEIIKITGALRKRTHEVKIQVIFKRGKRIVD